MIYFYPFLVYILSFWFSLKAWNWFAQGEAASNLFEERDGPLSLLTLEHEAFPDKPPERVGLKAAKFGLEAISPLPKECDWSPCPFFQTAPDLPTCKLSPKVAA